MANSVFKEHGPFSGSGFFQDMLLAGMTVQDAMIGSLEPTDGHRWRSSSELIEEQITYYRDMNNWQRGRNPQSMPELVECTLNRAEAYVKPPAKTNAKPNVVKPKAQISTVAQSGKTLTDSRSPLERLQEEMGVRVQEDGSPKN